ncbi:VOC family protein [Amycolatopsis sp. H20-H5]|uniref:VOC family protein n=1 Tax=Amycolatopsis sp. H20-H5 TaxID=3046309 RepID=UPI002DBC8D24|nr:VOC family protein [Amycolatopsis sp. H20-H5]MEC3979964.1 VOC family protein [Amycolatopsis sp. H20-H5]
MTSRPRLSLSGIVLDTPDTHTLADFYHRLLGWAVKTDEPGWAKLTAPEGGAGLSFQHEQAYVRPVWPAGPGDPRVQVHLDILVDDLDTAGAHAIAQGAALADHQPQDGVRVYFDPDGHPFCLFVS